MSTPKKQCMERIKKQKQLLEAKNKALMPLNPKLGPLHRGVLNYPGGEPRAQTTSESFAKSIRRMRGKLQEYVAMALAAGAKNSAVKAYGETAAVLIGQGKNAGLWGMLWVLAKRELASKQK